mmetsp:Transcript_47809/g.117261  ORF Transcript_47809/g.117261 Transcript_47809/m.117261 type:complete len:271 (-) Transcript_47809:215-1027(-)
MDAVQWTAIVLDWGSKHNRQVVSLALLDCLQLAPTEIVLDAIILRHGLVQLLHERLDASSPSEGLVQTIRTLGLTLLARDLKADSAPSCDHLPHLAQDLNSVGNHPVTNLHEFGSTPEVLQHRVEVVVRDVHVVVDLSHLAIVIGDWAAEGSDHELSHPLFDGLNLLLVDFEVEADPRIPEAPGIHHFHDRLHIHLPSKPIQNRLAIDHLGVRRQALGSVHQCVPHWFHGHNSLINSLILNAQAGHCFLAIRKEAIELIVGQTHALVNSD